MQQRDEAEFLEWIDNLLNYLNGPNDSSASSSLVLLANQWIEYFAKQQYPEISSTALIHFAYLSTQSLNKCKQRSHSLDWTILRKILAIWRNGCCSYQFRVCLEKSGFVDQLVTSLETLLEGEGSVLISVVLQLFANVTNDERRPLCLWNNTNMTPSSFYQLLLKTVKKEYESCGNGKLLLALEMVWSNQFMYLSMSKSWEVLLNDSDFWSTFLGWIHQHLRDSTELHYDILYWLFVMMERMAESAVLCDWLICMNRLLDREESGMNSRKDGKMTLEETNLFPFIAILRDALLVGEKSILLAASDAYNLCLWFQRLSCYSVADESHVAWLELVAVILADHFSQSIEEETKACLVFLVDSCCHILRLLQEDMSWTVLGDKVGLKTTLTRLLCNICSVSKEMIAYIIHNQSYLLTLLRQWQLDTEAPMSFEWTVFLFRLVCEQEEAPPIIVQTLQAFQAFSNSSQQSDVS